MRTLFIVPRWALHLPPVSTLPGLAGRIVFEDGEPGFDAGTAASVDVALLDDRAELSLANDDAGELAGWLALIGYAVPARVQSATHREYGEGWEQRVDDAGVQLLVEDRATLNKSDLLRALFRQLADEDTPALLDTLQQEKALYFDRTLPPQPRGVEGARRALQSAAYGLDGACVGAIAARGAAAGWIGAAPDLWHERWIAATVRPMTAAERAQSGVGERALEAAKALLAAGVVAPPAWAPPQDPGAPQVVDFWRAAQARTAARAAVVLPGAASSVVAGRQ